MHLPKLDYLFTICFSSSIFQANGPTKLSTRYSRSSLTTAGISSPMCFYCGINVRHSPELITFRPNARDFRTCTDTLLFQTRQCAPMPRLSASSRDRIFCGYCSSAGMQKPMSIDSILRTNKRMYLELHKPHTQKLPDLKALETRRRDRTTFPVRWVANVSPRLGLRGIANFDSHSYG